MATYSLAATGAPADNPALPLSLDPEDSVSRQGSRAAAMANNTPFLARGPDGGERWYTYDAERTIPGALNVLKLV